MKLLPQRLKRSTNKGFILITAILVIVVVAFVIGIVFSLVLLSLRKADSNSRQISVLDVSEAGINYYLWHLAHDPNDYKDGNATPANPPYGPYTHDFTDSSNNVIGTFTLYITPPPVGSNRVTVSSKGTINGGNENRTIVAELGIPSFANYAIVANDTVNHLRIGEGTETFGPVHNNGGVRFDGIAHAIVTSAQTTYNDPDHTGPNEDGVHTHQANPDSVFLAGRAFPVPAVNFSQITTDLTNLRTIAQASGIYYAASGSSGYHVVVKTNDTFDIYRVTGVSGQCSGQDTDRITSQVFITNRSFPANGVIFIEDKLWIDGQVDGAQATFVAARIGATQAQEKSIILNSDLEYTNYDGTDKLGLIAQRNISIGMTSEGAFSGSADNQEMRIDAAMLAQNGRVGRNYFARYCNSTYYQRHNITIYGSLGTANRYGFTWICGSTWTVGDSCDSGYQNRSLLYDPYLTLLPPPSFPTTGSYAILSWKEQ